MGEAVELVLGMSIAGFGFLVAIVMIVLVDWIIGKLER